MFYRVFSLLLSIASLTACQSSTEQTKQALSPNTVLESCKNALHLKDNQTSAQECPFAEQWFAHTEPDSLIHAEALAYLAEFLTASNPIAAANYYQQAILIHEKFNDNNPEVNALQIKQANILTDLSKWPEAEMAFKKALRRVDAKKTSDTIETADLLNRMAVVQLQQQLLTEAEQSLTRALSIREAKLDANDTALADTYNNLGYLYQSLAKPKDAEAYYRKAVSIQESAAATPYRQLFDALSNLASLLQNNGKPQESEAYWKKLLLVSEKGYGKDSAQYALVLNNLGLAAIAAHQNVSAENLFKAALEIREKQLGGKHILTAESANNLAVALSNQNKYSQAEPLMRQAFALTQATLGVNAPLTQQRWDSLQNLEKIAAYHAVAVNPAQQQASNVQNNKRR